ncbi:MAG: hypothetical protein K8F30_13580 [Taibaiella sp.]|nr:hypothetical protein [Taibaiella sp.]
MIAYDHTISRLQCEKKYDSIVHISRAYPSHDSIYLYGREGTVAHAYMQLGDTTNAMIYLERAVELQQYGELGQIHYSFGKYKLDSNAGYQRIIQTFDKLNSRYAGNLNMPVLNRCLEIYYTDQRVRNIWMIQGDSAKKAWADFIQWQCDSMNIAAMSSLMKDIGRFPGISDVGLSFLWNFRHIIAHWAGELNRDTLVAYLKGATLKGQIPNTYGPFILDKLEHYKGRPSIYGEYGDYKDYKDGVRHIKPIGDIEYVDQRRAEFLLPPLYTLLEIQNCKLPADYSRQSQKELPPQ